MFKVPIKFHLYDVLFLIKNMRIYNLYNKSTMRTVRTFYEGNQEA